MSVNKVQLANGETIIDISDSTVTPETLAEGVTAHDASGQKITGKMVPGGGASVQSDWNQTDETADDFIKNKPFEGKPTWDDVGSEKVVFYDEQNVSFTDIGVQFEISSAPTVGDTVTVEFDGVTYEVLVQDSGLGMLFAGDIGIVMGEPGGSSEPFCVAFGVDSPYGMIFVGDLSQSHNIKIAGRSIIKIPTEYVKSYVKFYLGQGENYITHDVFGSEGVTLDQLTEACASATLLLDYGAMELYAPLIVDFFAGENYGSVTIMGKTGELETYYTAEYTG